jgi:hypothetical protein
MRYFQRLAGWHAGRRCRTAPLAHARVAAGQEVHRVLPRIDATARFGMFGILLAAGCGAGAAPAKNPNYDEAAVRPYELPNVLAGPDGVAVDTAEQWRLSARPHHLGVLERHVYGRRLPPVPVRPVDVKREDVVLAGDVPAVRIQAVLELRPHADGDDSGPLIDVLLYLPRGTTGSPVFLALNFHGNQSLVSDPDVRITRSWIINKADARVTDNRGSEASRGTQVRRWPVARMLTRGYGMATACCGDFYPDRQEGAAESAPGRLGLTVAGRLRPDEPGAIAVWAWGLSRILDWLVTLPEVDPSRVIVVGHSRLGKAALWSGGCDERFAMVVSNDSGCGGAALSRRNFGEDVAAITGKHPHWFCPAFASYAGRESDLPCDQHVLLALAAPRPLYVASASEDLWADPRGEFLAAVAAGPVWSLFGLTGLGAADFPEADRSIGDRVGYHVRTGGHDLLEFDWERFADFADRHLRPR